MGKSGLLMRKVSSLLGKRDRRGVEWGNPPIEFEGDVRANLREKSSFDRRERDERARRVFLSPPDSGGSICRSTVISKAPLIEILFFSLIGKKNPLYFSLFIINLCEIIER